MQGLFNNRIRKGWKVIYCLKCMNLSLAKSRRSQLELDFIKIAINIKTGKPFFVEKKEQL